MRTKAYHDTQNKVETQRAVEYRQLGELTSALIHARDHESDGAGRAKAVHLNQLFWSHLRIHALEAVKSLPQEMRLSMIALAGWVEKNSVEAALGNASLDDLIAVNQQLMEGLKPYQGSLAGDALQAS